MLAYQLKRQFWPLAHDHVPCHVGLICLNPTALRITAGSLSPDRARGLAEDETRCTCNPIDQGKDGQR